MKKMRRGQHNYPGDGYYRIVQEDWGYRIYIASDKYNQYRTYEYDGGCETRDEVEKELQTHTFPQIVKLYRDLYVYCECVEELG